MPLAALQMNKFFSKLTNLMCSSNRWIFVIMPVLLLLSFLTHSVVSAKISVSDFGQSLTSPNYNKESFDFQTTLGQFNTFNCLIQGCPSGPEETQGGAVQGMGKMVGLLYDSQPASGVGYAMHIMQNFGVVDKAYAQTTGFGFNQLTPLLPLWESFRNFSYLLFVIIFVAMGFGIMFRMKLNPQTVATIQSTLPRIVIALLLVTFSYAIAGFMIDLMYVFIAIVTLLFGQAGVGLNATDLQGQYMNGNFFQVLHAMWQAIPLRAIIPVVGGSVGTGAVVGGIVGFLGFAASAASGAWIGGLLIALILGITMLVLIIRLFFSLLRSYIAIILGVIFAPLQITLGVLPGLQNMGFAAWFRNMLAHIMVFPAVAFVLILARVLGSHLHVNGLWSPPLLAGGGVASNILGPILGLGLLFIINQVPDAVRKTIGEARLEFNPDANTGVARAPLGFAGGFLQAEGQNMIRDNSRSTLIGSALSGVGGFLSGHSKPGR